MTSPWPHAESSLARPCGTCGRCGGTLYAYLAHQCRTNFNLAAFQHDGAVRVLTSESDPYRLRDERAHDSFTPTPRKRIRRGLSDALVALRREADNRLWIEVASEHRHASPRVWCEICKRIAKARDELGAKETTDG